MMSFKPFIFASTAMLLLAVPAAAQMPVPGMVRVQANISFFVAGATGDNEDAQKTREKAQRLVYQMAARECDLLRDVLAKDCRMELINSNVGRQFSQQQQEGYTVNGSMAFQITLK